MPDRGNEVFAILERARRVWAIAPIHGHADRLAALHSQLLEQFRAGDRLVYLGNYVGIGPDVVAVMDELLRFRRLLLTGSGLEPWDVAYLRGAQEEMWEKLLQVQFAANPKEVLAWMLQQGIASTLTAYGSSIEESQQRCREGTIGLIRWTNGLRHAVRAHPGHDTLLTSLRRYAMTDDRQLLFVHAGIDPRLPLSEQGDTFWWGHQALEELDEPYLEFKRVIRGVDRQPDYNPNITDFTASLGGGCGLGDHLYAVCFTGQGEPDNWLEA